MLKYFRRLEQNPESILSNFFFIHREQRDGLSTELERILQDITNWLMNYQKTAKAGSYYIGGRESRGMGED